MNEELPFRQEDIDENKLLTVLMAVIPVLFFLPLIMKSNSRYLNFFANQCLLLTIALIVCAVVPFLGWLCEILVFVMWIVNIVNAVQAEPKPMPFIGKNIIIKYESFE